MLVRFTIENWKSFKDETIFSMEASRERRHNDRIPVSNGGTKILPITALYGGNAAGKSNFFKALSFVRHCVVDGAKRDERPITSEPFLLDSEALERPTSFSVVLLSEESLYEYSFSIERGAISSERLARLSRTNENLLYERNGAGITFGKSTKNKDLLELAAKATQPNKLFLSVCSLLEVNNFRNAFDWFKKSLLLITSSRNAGAIILFEDSAVYSTMRRMLPLLDTGISRIDKKETPLDHPPDAMRKSLEDMVGEGTYHELPSPHSSAGAGFLTREKGKLMVKSIVPYHRRKDGVEVEFNIEQESDGTLHLVNLLPSIILLAMASRKHVVFIDEFGQGLHTNLTRELLEKYLMSCNRESRSQLVLTTHDSHLMDQELLRRDEMWVAEKGADGNSSLIPISCYKDLRYDKDLDKTYLRGVLGGAPRLQTQAVGIPFAE